MVIVLLAGGLYWQVHKSQRAAQAQLVGSVESVLTLRSLEERFSSGSIMRSSVLQCQRDHGLGAGELEGRVELKDIGKDFGFAWAREASIGLSASSGYQAVVPNASIFQPGEFVWIQTLDADRLETVMEVSGVDTKASRVTFSAVTPQVPSHFSCRFKNPAPMAQQIFVPAKSRNLSLSKVRVSRLHVAQLVGNRRTFSIEEWPVSGVKPGEAVPSQVLVDDFISATIEQNFKVSGGESGDYLIKLTFIINPDPDKKENSVKSFQISASYRKHSLGITNPELVPTPPSLRPLAVTCSLLSQQVQDSFRSSTNADRLMVTRLTATWTEQEALTGIGSPSIDVTIVPKDTTAAETISCWTPELVKEKAKGAPDNVLEGPGIGENFRFSLQNPPVAGPLGVMEPVKAVYCYLPVNATAVATMSFGEVTGSGFIRRSIHCSPLELQGTAVSWKYVTGYESVCWNSGAIRIGRLINSLDAGLGGPLLSVDPNGCVWSGASTKSCDVAAVLKDSPSALLESVVLRPTNILISGRRNDQPLRCVP